MKWEVTVCFNEALWKDEPPTIAWQEKEKGPSLFTFGFRPCEALSVKR